MAGARRGVAQRRDSAWRPRANCGGLWGSVRLAAWLVARTEGATASAAGTAPDRWDRVGHVAWAVRRRARGRRRATDGCDVWDARDRGDARHSRHDDKVLRCDHVLAAPQGRPPSARPVGGVPAGPLPSATPAMVVVVIEAPHAARSGPLRGGRTGWRRSSPPTSTLRSPADGRYAAR